MTLKSYRGELSEARVKRIISAENPFRIEFKSYWLPLPARMKFIEKACNEGMFLSYNLREGKREFSRVFSSRLRSVQK